MSMPSSVLNTNIASMIAQRNVGTAQTRLVESVERLSSGLRINRTRAALTQAETFFGNRDQQNY